MPRIETLRDLEELALLIHGHVLVLTLLNRGQLVLHRIPHRLLPGTWSQWGLMVNSLRGRDREPPRSGSSGFPKDVRMV